jgi:outer membrane protein OmpA-like peptidoglycan-associated protein
MNKFFLFFLILSITSCAYTEKVRDGKTAFERKQYHVAIPMLEKEYKKEKSKAQKGKIAFLIAESFQKSGKIEQSLEWYKNAYDNSYGSEALRAYAQNLKFTEQYALAMQTYKELGIEIGSSFEVKKDLQSCQNALNWLSPKARSPYVVEKVTFNSPFDDYAPSHYIANQLVITSDRPNPDSPKNYKWTGRAFSDLFLIDKQNFTIKNFGSQINTLSNEGCATFNANQNLMIFTRSVAEVKNGDEYMKLFYTKREGVLWSSPKELAFCKEKVNYWHPALSSDASKLYFSANDADGFGGFDLYSVERKENGEWGEPKLLPRNINTFGNEVFPTLHNDTLYFSSDTHQGMGGLDIFKTYPLNSGWITPQNLRSPINSGADDFALLVDNQAISEEKVVRKGFFTSNRKGGVGGDDIYSFKKIVLPPLPIDSTSKPKTDNSKKPEFQMILDGYVLEKIYQQADNPNSKIIGRRPLINTPVTINFGKEKKSVLTNDEGYFTVVLSENADYQFTAMKPEYLTKSIPFTTRGIVQDSNNPIQRFEVELILDKIYKNKEITLENIYYDFDKSDIRDDAKPTLNALARILTENPSIKIQLSSHTDCQGNDDYNEDLSQRRAQSAVDYMISLGINTNRLSAKGYGETQPAVICVCAKCTDAENQANRRTTFKIVE